MFTQIYLGSVLLEPKRWSQDRRPSLCLRDWTARMLHAGFDGWDFWEFHGPASPADAVRVYNSYLLPERATPGQIADLADRVIASGAGALKFNVGNEVDAPARAVPALMELMKCMPAMDLLCECHPGTALEDSRLAIPWIQSLPECFGVILHPLGEKKDFSLACQEHIPNRVRLMHLQLKNRDTGKRACLDECPDFVRERLDHLRDFGYRGPATLEFTRGVGGGPEDVPETLFQNALRDLTFLLR